MVSSAQTAKNRAILGGKLCTKCGSVTHGGQQAASSSAARAGNSHPVDAGSPTPMNEQARRSSAELGGAQPSSAELGRGRDRAPRHFSAFCSVRASPEGPLFLRLFCDKSLKSNFWSSTGSRHSDEESGVCRKTEAPLQRSVTERSNGAKINAKGAERSSELRCRVPK